MVACQPAVEQSLGFRHIIQHWGRKYTCMEADLLSYKGGSSVEQWGETETSSLKHPGSVGTTALKLTTYKWPVLADAIPARDNNAWE